MKRLLLILAACGSNPPQDITGPFTGPTTRYTIDGFTPVGDPVGLGDDLDGNGTVDNAIGYVLRDLTAEMDVTTHADAVLSLVPTEVLIQQNDSIGAVSFGDGIPVGGVFENGRFTSNRTATSPHLASGTFVLPIFPDADPTTLPLQRAEIDLVPDETGYVATIRAVISHSDAVAAASSGLAQMITNDPQDHIALGNAFDTNRDGIVTADEAASAPLVANLLVPDLAQDFLSFGFAVHLRACDSGTCATPTTDTCFDRVLDGDETAIDCGGSCGACAVGMTCNVAADCQSEACDGGHCAGYSCSDGIQDGFESHVDCGAATCKHCLGDPCETNDDCYASRCDQQQCVPF